MKKIAIKGSLKLQKAFCKESGIEYYRDWGSRDYINYPYLFARDGNFNGCNSTWIGDHSDYKLFDLPSQWNKALEYLTSDSEVKFGDFTAEIDKETKRVIIADRGSLTFDQCNKIYYKISPENVGDYTIIPNITSVDFGCVKNIPIADVLNVIKLINE